MPAIRPGDPAPTDAQTEKICLWLSKGAIIDTAIAAAGVPRSMFNRWLRAGAENLEPYATFAARVEAAVLLFECKLLQLIEGHTNKNLAAATFLFNLRFKMKYDAAARQEAGLEAETPMAQARHKEVSEEELEAAEKRALEASKFVEKPKVLNFGLEARKETKH